MSTKDLYDAVSKTFGSAAHLRALKEALESGLEPNLQDTKGTTLLHKAVDRDYEESVRLLRWPGLPCSVC